jgi:hypothetical protein
MNAIAYTCGGELKIKEPINGIILSQDDSPLYSSNMQCQWLIGDGSKPNSRVKLEIIEFNTECGWDYLKIYDGYNSQSTPIAKLCGNRDKELGFNDIIVSSSQYLYVSFESDSYAEAPGFLMNYHILGIISY